MAKVKACKMTILKFYTFGKFMHVLFFFVQKIFEGKSSFEAYKDYNAWEKAIVKMKANLTEEERVGLMSVFQTCDYWEQVFMEIIGKG